MKKYEKAKDFKRFIFIILFFFAFVFVPQTSASANDVWISVRSENFYLVGNAGEPEMRRAAVKLEQFRHIFTQLFREMNFKSPIPTTVVVFKDDKSFGSFKPMNEDGSSRDWVLGYFLPGKDVNYIALPVKGDKDISFSTIYHEYVHFLIDNSLGRANIPPWFNEGYAEFYEQTVFGNDGKATLGAVNSSHLSFLRKNGFMPFEKFFAVDYYTLNRQSKEYAVGFYAQAWATMHYLIQADKGARNYRLQLFSEFLMKGKTQTQAFQEAFKTDYAGLEAEVKKYIERKTFEVSLLNIDKNFVVENQLRTLPLTTAEAKAYQGDLLFRLDRKDEASRFLRESLALDPELSFANATFGLMKLQENNYPEAIKYLEKAVETGAQNYFAHYSFAYVLSREGMSDFGFIVAYNLKYAEKIRESLRRAIALNPEYAESFHLYAFINITRNENLDEALEMINKALKIAPGNQWYRLRTAEIYMRKQDFANARKISQNILQTAPDDRLKLYAQNTLNLTNAWEAQIEDIKKQREQPENEVTDKILSEEEIAALNEKAMNESLNQSLRKPRTGEKRIVGFLTNIECGAKEVIYFVKSLDERLEFRSNSFDDIIFTAFAVADSKVGCGIFKAEVYAVITYKTGGELNRKISGETVAVEFVPKNFKFIEP
ncbi:MAG: DUF1570 domain-containing protein [Acidobacteriota bacterium]|nr:DUF1570 domain-containing protein [Acidobacteriota bacterium]